MADKKKNRIFFDNSSQPGIVHTVKKRKKEV